MANKYPVQVRMKEMSKQEEILAKRKREIEKRMKEEAGGGSTPPAGPPPKKHTVNPPLPPVAPRPRPSTSVSPGIQVPNKFNNDGSFLEQFKKLAKKEPDIKDEKPFFTDKIRGVKPLPTPKVKVLSQVPPPPLRLGPTSTSTSALQQVKIENDLEKERCGDEGPKAEVEPDWFQDALKRAQAKAKELLEGPPVSLSACPSVDDSSNSLAGKKRRSRWGDKTDPETSPAHHVPPAAATPPPATAATPATTTTTTTSTSSGPPSVCLSVPDSLMDMVGEGEHMQAIQGIMVTRLTRSNPAIISYAHKVFGSLDLSEAQWRQCEDQMKMNVVYQLLQAKKQEAERLEQQGKVKYEYDSDEDVDGGTWEHKRRAMEMQETQAKAVELTNSAEGKHHIGDFLPPDELARFMEKYRAIKEGRDPDLSDYQEHKLTEENVGYRMLKSMGWTEGMGLGAEGKGITAPVNQNGRSESQGLGVDRPDSLEEEDDEYDAYRKRMMLAYRFRPNPLNNPRRAYY